MPKIVASIEARMNSSRFPGKVLADIQGQPALSRLLQRLRRSQYLDGIILATTISPQDDILEVWAKGENLPIYRGSEEDVLGRVLEAHRQMHSDIIVEITGDCILIDPEIVDLGIKTYLDKDCDVVSNTWEVSYPMGIDVQVFSFQALEWVAKTIEDPAVREHVSLYFYEHPEIYRMIHLQAPESRRAPDYRLMLDYPEDLQLINQIYQRLEPVYQQNFGVDEILRLLKHAPALLEINQHCIEKSVR